MWKLSAATVAITVGLIAATFAPANAAVCENSSTPGLNGIEVFEASVADLATKGVEVIASTIDDSAKVLALVQGVETVLGTYLEADLEADTVKAIVAIQSDTPDWVFIKFYDVDDCFIVNAKVPGGVFLEIIGEANDAGKIIEGSI